MKSALLLLALVSMGVNEEEPVESQIVNSEIVVSDESVIETETWVSDISQQANDIIAIIKEFLSQPLVIGGTSITLGALISSILLKVYQVLKSNKKTKDLVKKFEELKGKVDGLDFKGNIDELTEQYEILKQVAEIVMNSTKNVKTKEQLQQILNQCEIKEKKATKTIEKTKEIIEPIVEQVKEIVSSVIPTE